MSFSPPPSFPSNLDWIPVPIVIKKSKNNLARNTEHLLFSEGTIVHKKEGTPNSFKVGTFGDYSWKYGKSAETVRNYRVELASVQNLIK